MSKKNKARDLRKLSAGPSFADISTAVGAALNERFPRVEETDDYAWVVDIFDATVVYQFKGDLFEVSYSYDGKTAVLGSDAVEVARTYAPVASPAPAPTPIEAAPVVASQNPAPEAMSARAPVPATITLAKDSTKMDPSLAKQIFDVLKKADARGRAEAPGGALPEPGSRRLRLGARGRSCRVRRCPADGADAAAPRLPRRWRLPSRRSSASPRLTPSPRWRSRSRPSAPPTSSSPRSALRSRRSARC